ncbi:ectonucleotide pyrophosphatase/phosphodiesterase family member 5-like [Physella acuta]|uniref:ectonucleotide pyrophosphatase/phosphodiesterase family member 5-like n=1 Tax=Physella acuta TaxID=109671 RepID=UPI0027DBF649|nr:ectonucleotide pyrophosphatase/phosphodiesterase family member 5-like [Physella acuta]
MCSQLVLLALLPLIFAAGPRPKVLLVSMDGFRYDYLKKTETPNFDRLVSQGVTMPFMNNSFVTSTFPCHYTMATGLYSEVHGIVANRMYDPEFNSFFGQSNKESRWWEGGEPIWITAKKAGLKTGVYFWPGSESPIHGEMADRWMPYNSSVPFEERVEAVVSWMARDDYDLTLVYFSEPDESGHRHGPESPAMVPVIQRMDAIVGLIVQKLNDTGLEDKVNVIITSDHGMTAVDLKNRIIDLSHYLNDSLLQFVVDEGASSHILPKPGKNSQLVAALSGVPHMRVMLKENIPDRFHLKHNRRVMPVFAYADEGWTISANATKRQSEVYNGGHGYDNELPHMKPIFIAKGPAFRSNQTVEPIQSVDIYPLICHILKINPSPNNGSLDRASRLLNLETKRSSSNDMALTVAQSTVFILSFLAYIF